MRWPPKTTKCSKCRRRITPERVERGPNLRERFDYLIIPTVASFGYRTFDRFHFHCPECSHEWRPRLQERHILLQIIMWPILIAGCLLGIVVIFVALQRNFP